MGTPAFKIIRNGNEIRTGRRGMLMLEVLDAAMSENTASSAAARYASTIMPRMGRGRTLVIGFGKASAGMYRGVSEVMKDSIDMASIIVPVGSRSDIQDGRIQVFLAPHPFPDKRTVDASHRLISMCSGLTQEDNVIVLVSGGGSSLFEIPAQGISIEDETDLTRCLMDAGADIFQLNRIRQAMSTVKGGKLARFLQPAKVFGLMISDVPGDRMEFIASGPLSPSSISIDDIRNIEDAFTGCKAMIESMLIHLILEPPEENLFRNVTNNLVLKNSDIVSSAVSKLRESGIEVINLGSGLTGEVQSFAENLHAVLAAIYSLRGYGFWFTAGGETTSRVVGNGRGGRNQELALRFGLLEKSKGTDFAFLSAGSDGIDGNSDCMGGIIDSETVNTIDAAEARNAIESSDSSTFLKRHGLAIYSGPTGNNVSDIILGYYGGGYWVD